MKEAVFSNTINTSETPWRAKQPKEDIKAETAPEASDNKSDEFYKRELAPLFRVFKEENESPEDCEARLFSELSKDVSRLQDLNASLVPSPEQDLIDIKNLLMEKMRSALQTYENKLESDLSTDEIAFIKKAKIVLVVAGDLSGLKSYMAKNHIKECKTDNLSNFFHASKGWNSKDDSRLKAEEVRSLLSSGLAPVLLYINRFATNSEDFIKEVPDELLQYYIKNKVTNAVSRAIERQADPAGYSKETVDLLLASNQAYNILKHLNIFENSLDEASLKKAVLCYSPSYPYQLADLTEYISKSNFSEELKIELTDYIFKHQNFGSSKYNDLSHDFQNINKAAQEIKLDPIVKGLKEITGANTLYSSIRAKDLSSENLAKVKSYVERGYIVILSQFNCADFVDYFFKNEYQWLMDSLVKNNQENLYFFTGEINIEDRKKYLQKLADEGREVELYEIVNKTGDALISKEVFANLINKGYNISPKICYDTLNEDVFVKILNNKPLSLEAVSLFDNIEKFSFNPYSKLVYYAMYKELISFVDSNFITKFRSELFNIFNLDIKSVKQTSFKIVQIELNDKSNLLAEKLPLLYPHQSANQLDSFHEEFGFRCLSLPKDELRDYLDLALSIPSHVVRENSLGKECFDIIKPLSVEARTEFLLGLNRMLSFYDEVTKDIQFINYYLHEHKRDDSLAENFTASLQKYNSFYNKLSDEDKKFFKEIFPWSERVAALKPEVRNTRLFGCMDGQKIPKFDFSFPADGEIICKYLNNFGTNSLSGLLKFVREIVQHGNNLSPQIIQTLRDDFNIEVDKENYNQADTLSAMADFYKKIALRFEQPNELYLHESDVKNIIRATKNALLDGNLSDDDYRLANNFLNKYGLESENRAVCYVKDISDKENWQHNLLAYISAAEDVVSFSENEKNTVLNYFAGDYRDVCLENMNKKWQQYLREKDNEIPADLQILSEVIDNVGGAGNLKYIEALSDLIRAVDKSFNDPKTVARTKSAVKNFLLFSEERITKDKLSQDERAQFYNLTKEIIEAAPSLLASLETIFDKASSKDVKTILKDLMPLYQLELIIVQKNDGSDNISYNPRELVTIRKSLKTIASDLNSKPENSSEIFDNEKQRLGDFIKNGFRDRFGLIKIPAEFSRDNMRSIQNCLRYVANISGRNIERETLISFYLGLQLNGEWKKFRQGLDINVEEYLSGDKAKIIKSMLETKKSNILPADIANLEGEKIASFQEILQKDVITNMIGNVETIDVKLGNINRSAQELIDPDAYPDKKDKDIIKLLSQNGRLVGAVLAKTYKNLELNPDEQILQHKIAEIFSVSAWNGEVVMKIQNEISPFSLITNMIIKLSEEGVTKNIDELQKYKDAPSVDIIRIFNSMDENFKTTSGAMALSRDLEYLEELVVKNDSKLSFDDKEKVTIYIDYIRKKMKALESSFQKVKEYFDKVNNSSHLISSEPLKDRLAEIKKIVYSTDNNEVIITQLTSNLDLIIENMRQCLGCTRKEANNDTNLAFGDYNKFFLMSQREKGRGSIADEIVFFMPITNKDGRQEMSFIMDNLYGKKSSDILLSHVATVYKKYSAIKKEFKDVNISISVSTAALNSSGLSTETFQSKIREKISELESVEYVSDIKVNIPKSSLSDNYVEFSSKGARGTGEANFSAVILK